jgi:hypothetical protein
MNISCRRVWGKFQGSSNILRITVKWIFFCQPWYINSSEVFCNGGLANATIYLYGGSESLVYDYTLTDSNGSFSFNHLLYAAKSCIVSIP